MREWIGTVVVMALMVVLLAAVAVAVADLLTTLCGSPYIMECR